MFLNSCTYQLFYAVIFVVSTSPFVRTAPNPDHRMTAKECLDKLNVYGAIDAPAVAAAASLPVPEAPHFDRLVHFVDTFCASGFTRVKYNVQLLNAGDDLEVEVINRDGFPVVDIETDSYNAAKRSWMPEKMKFRRCVTQNREWLFVRQGSQRYEVAPGESESSRVQRVKSICNDVSECLKPDYFVYPPSISLPVLDFSSR